LVGIAGACDFSNRGYDSQAKSRQLCLFVLACSFFVAQASPLFATLPGNLSSSSATMAAAWEAEDTASNGSMTNGEFTSHSAKMAAAWEDDDALAAELQDAPEEVAPQEPSPSQNKIRSVITKRSIAPPIDLFDADERIAQLPNDPFDEPSGESIPELEQRSNLDAVESALDREMKRRDREIEEQAVEQQQQQQQLESPENPTAEEPSFETELTHENANDSETERSPVRQQTPQADLEFQLDVPERPLSETVEPIRRGIGTTPSEEAAQSQQSCEEELAALKADRISTVDLSIRIDGVPGEDFPYECPLGDEQLQPRVWPEITYTWKASALCHKPLYYEDVQLERYGHTWPRCAQPLVSGAHFFSSTAILPYKMGLQTPDECVYALGHYRPGSCAPYYIEALPFTWRAAAFQAGVVTGINFALP
jgi:hypothetical protein